jgi:hypothetical protein
VWQIQSSTKSLLIVFSQHDLGNIWTMDKVRKPNISMKGIVHHEFVPPNTTANFDFDILRRLRENVRRKSPELWLKHNWLLHHSNAPFHTSVKTTAFVTNNMVIVPYPPHSLDLLFC